jgi:AcrR family transcriptional regulator
MRSRKKPSGKSAVTDKAVASILDGAARAFGKLGYAATRVEDVLEASGLSRPTFYKVFDSKDDVFEALSERHHREIRERIIRSLEGVSDPPRQLENVVDAFMRWRAELGPIGRVLDQEARTGTRLSKHRRETLDAMSAWATERFRAGGRGAPDPVLIYGLIGAMETIADALLSKPPVTEATIERAKRVALRVVGGSLADAGDAVPPLPLSPSKKPVR